MCFVSSVRLFSPITQWLLGYIHFGFTAGKCGAYFNLFTYIFLNIIKMCLVSL